MLLRCPVWDKLHHVGSWPSHVAPESEPGPIPCHLNISAWASPRGVLPHAVHGANFAIPRGTPRGMKYTAVYCSLRQLSSRHLLLAAGRKGFWRNNNGCDRLSQMRIRPRGQLRTVASIVAAAPSRNPSTGAHPVSAGCSQDNHGAPRHMSPAQTLYPPFTHQQLLQQQQQLRSFSWYGGVPFTRRCTGSLFTAAPLTPVHRSVAAAGTCTSWQADQTQTMGQVTL
jgi:hypothetical protein